MGEIIFKTELIKGAKGDRGEAGQADSIPTDGVIAFQGETVPDGYEETDPGDVFDEVYEDINAVKDMISDEYDTTATYNAGNYCIHENALYKCTATTTGLWDSSKWVLTSASDETKANAEAIEAMVNVYGSKNILPEQTVSGSDSGITWVVNADGSIAVSGTPTADVEIPILTRTNLLSPDCHYVLTGCPAGGSRNTYFLEVGLWVGSSFYAGYSDTGNGNDFISSDGRTYVSCAITIKQGAGNVNLVFYPMIRDIRITDDTYVPYAMTNRELTERMKVTKGTYISDSGLATIAVEKLAGYYLAGVTCNHAGGYLCSFSNHSSTDYYVVIMDFDATNNTISFMKGFETELILTWIKE